MLKVLSTAIAMASGMLVMVKFLPSLTVVLGMENSVSVPLRNLLTQAMVGRGSPSAVQLRERASGFRSLTMLGGDAVMEGGTTRKN